MIVAYAGGAPIDPSALQLARVGSTVVVTTRTGRLGWEWQADAQLDR